MTRADLDPPLSLKGWSIFAHPQFLDTVESLVAEVERLRIKHPKDYAAKNATKRLAAIVKLAFEIIPQDPTRPEYRQGATLGDEYTHWFRVKFFQQYRLFFRYHVESRIIIYGWVNDENTKRSYESDSDAYRTFRRPVKCNGMLGLWQVPPNVLRSIKRQLPKRIVAKINRDTLSRS